MAVKENVLNNPALVTEADCRKFLTSEGKGWLFETENAIAGFAIIDFKTNNIWALFVDPAFEKKGIVRILHDAMLDWHFANSSENLWLSTAPGTRAEKFYRSAGWKETGMTSSGEIRFEMERMNRNVNKTLS
jgi:GNAT superfamily N-acetyltransferase